MKASKSNSRTENMVFIRCKGESFLKGKLFYFLQIPFFIACLMQKYQGKDVNNTGKYDKIGLKIIF